MDTFFKRENEMWKMPAKKRIQTRIVSASAVKRVLDLLSVCPATHLKMFMQKRNIQTTTQQSSLLQKCGKTSLEKTQITKFENSFHIWINIGYICECTLSALSRVK